MDVSRLAALELARRSAYGVFLHPAIMLIFVLGTSIGTDFPFACFAVIGTLLLFSTFRFVLARGFEVRYERYGERMVVLFAALMTLHNLTFSISASTVIWYYGFSIESGILLVFVAVSAAAGTSSLAVRRDIHLLFLLCTIVPSTIVLLSFWEIEALPVFAASGLYLLFLIREGKSASNTFRDMAKTQLALKTSNSKLQELNLELNEEIAARLGTQNKLEGVESRFSVFLDHSPDPVIVISEQKIIYANHAATVFFGRDIDTLINYVVYDLVHNDYLQQLDDVQQAAEPEDSILLEIGFLKPDGSTVYGEARWSRTQFGDVQATLAIIRDQTLRRSGEEALRRSEQDFKTLIEESPDPIVVHVDQKLVYANQATQRLSGYSSEELDLKPIVELLHPEDLRTFLERQAKYTGGEELPPWEMRFTTKGGQVLSTEVHGFNASFSGYENARIVQIRDLTYRRATEQALRERENKLRQAQKLEAIGTLAGGIAHDFNNMLNSIVGYSELAMAEVDENSLVYENLNAVLLASQRATDLVDQILTFSRRDHENKQTLELESCVRSALVLLKQSIPTSIELKSHFNTRTSTVLADQTQIQQVIINLYTNAADAIGKLPGIIELSLDDFKLESDGQGSLAAGSYLRLIIRDDGRGMTEEVLEHLFDPFFTTKEVGAGPGLGLSMVHSLVEGHRGLIEVASNVATGTTFTLYFPRSEGQPQEKPLGDQIDGKGDERILAVDDDEMVLRMLERTLLSLGYQVVAKRDGVEALEAFKAEPDGFNLVISDVQMPKMTGNDLAREILNIRSEQAIILCSGYSQLITEDEALAMGVRCYLAKPIRRQTLLTSIRSALDQNLTLH